MKPGISQQEIERTAVTLGLPGNQSFINRRIGRAFDLVNTNKVSEIDDGIFRVHSQYDASKAYIVNVNHGDPSCDCRGRANNPPTFSGGTQHESRLHCNDAEISRQS